MNKKNNELIQEFMDKKLTELYSEKDISKTDYNKIINIINAQKNTFTTPEKNRLNIKARSTRKLFYAIFACLLLFTTTIIKFNDFSISQSSIVSKNNTSTETTSINTKDNSSISHGMIASESNNTSSDSIASKDNATSEFSMVDGLNINGISYILRYNKVITDARIIDTPIGSIKYLLTQNNFKDEIKNDFATNLDVGTIVYSIKGIQSEKAVAVKKDGKWLIYEKPDENFSNSPSIYTEDMPNAEKIVVTTTDENGNRYTREITDRSLITEAAYELKNAKATSDHIFFTNQKLYSFYFLTRDSNGIGKIVNSYNLYFQDAAFNGYINANETYIVSPRLNSIISSQFDIDNSPYDIILGGKQQIYDSYLSPKLILRKLIKQNVSSKFEVALLNEGDKIWQDGKLSVDNLDGKYKLQITMKDTTIQNKVCDEAISNISKIPGAKSISFSKGEVDTTTIMTIGFDNKPNYDFQENADTFIIIFKW